MSSAPLLSVRNLDVAFGRHQVLRSVSFEVQSGEVVAVLGRSGSGKTVLLRTIAGLLSSSSGRVDFGFKSVNPVPLGFAFQQAPLFPWLTILENLLLCTHTANPEPICLRYLEKVGLESFKNHYPRDISGGMAQKVNLLRALINQCELILMDEPFASLDGFQRAELQQFTYDVCRSQDRAILLITHDIDEAILLANRVLILGASSGKIDHSIVVGIDKPADLGALRANSEFRELYRLIRESVKTSIEGAEHAL